MLRTRTCVTYRLSNTRLLSNTNSSSLDLNKFREFIKENPDVSYTASALWNRSSKPAGGVSQLELVDRLAAMNVEAPFLQDLTEAPNNKRAYGVDGVMTSTRSKAHIYNQLLGSVEMQDPKEELNLARIVFSSWDKNLSERFLTLKFYSSKLDSSERWQTKFPPNLIPLVREWKEMFSKFSDMHHMNFNNVDRTCVSYFCSQYELGKIANDEISWASRNLDELFDAEIVALLPKLQEMSMAERMVEEPIILKRLGLSAEEYRVLWVFSLLDDSLSVIDGIKHDSTKGIDMEGLEDPGILPYTDTEDYLGMGQNYTIHKKFLEASGEYQQNVDKGKELYENAMKNVSQDILENFHTNMMGPSYQDPSKFINISNVLPDNDDVFAKLKYEVDNRRFAHFVIGKPEEAHFLVLSVYTKIKHEDYRMYLERRLIEEGNTNREEEESDDLGHSEKQEFTTDTAYRRRDRLRDTYDLRDPQVFWTMVQNAFTRLDMPGTQVFRDFNFKDLPPSAKQELLLLTEELLKGDFEEHPLDTFRRLTTTSDDILYRLPEIEHRKQEVLQYRDAKDWEHARPRMIQRASKYLDDDILREEDAFNRGENPEVPCVDEESSDTSFSTFSERDNHPDYLVVKDDYFDEDHSDLEDITPNHPEYKASMEAYHKKLDELKVQADAIKNSPEFDTDMLRGLGIDPEKELNKLRDTTVEHIQDEERQYRVLQDYESYSNPDDAFAHQLKVIEAETEEELKYESMKEDIEKTANSLKEFLENEWSYRNYELNELVDILSNKSLDNISDLFPENIYSEYIRIRDLAQEIPEKYLDDGFRFGSATRDALHKIKSGLDLVERPRSISSVLPEGEDEYPDKPFIYEETIGRAEDQMLWNKTDKEDGTVTPPEVEPVLEYDVNKVNKWVPEELNLFRGYGDIELTELAPFAVEERPDDRQIDKPWETLEENLFKKKGCPLCKGRSCKPMVPMKYTVYPFIH